MNSDLITRGVTNIIPNPQELEKKLSSNQPLNIYLGIDPTAPQIHLGHAVVLRKLQHFADLGHHVTLLIGDFTALIGDTSDKDTERPVLTTEQIQQNFQTYKQQAEKMLDFSKITIKYNSEWLSQLNFTDIVKLTQHFSAGDFYSRELIKTRLEAGKRVGLHEVLYAVMQGYDMYHLDADLQLGGADQTFNMQAGRTLQKDLRSKETFILVTNYLTGTDGRKMSKSWGNAIWLNDEPNDIYGKVMSLKDDLIPEYALLATNLPIAEVENIKQQISAGANPMQLKKQLAWQITMELYDENAANQAQNHFETVHQQHQVPTEIQEFALSREVTEIKPIDLLTQMGVATSNSEARRLIEQGGLKIDGNKHTDSNTSITVQDGMVIQSGKRQFFKLKLQA